MASVALVSGSDFAYYPLLREWVHSIRRFTDSLGIDICIIDGGLTAHQREELAPFVKSIIAPEWPTGVAAKRVEGKDRLKPCLCRPFINKIFDGYDTYVWMDADTWVQKWAAVEAFIAIASKKRDRMVIINGADRSSPKQLRIKWFGPWPYSVRNFYFSNAKRAFGTGIAKKLVDEYVLNAGCFALCAAAPFWEAWQRNAVIAANKGKIFTAEQLSLGKTHYIDGYPVELVPSHMHWILSCLPMFDEDKRVFVEPYEPHEELGVIHMCGVDEARASRNVKVRIQTVRGGTVETSLRYPLFDGGELAQARPKRG